MSNTIYKLRGYILAIFAIALIATPPSTEPISASGILLIFVAIVIRVTARRSIGLHSRGSKLEAPRLVREGIYSVVRHPLYLSNGLAGSGFILLHLHWQNLTFAYLGMLWIFIGFLAMNEDRFLKSEFGEDFENFAAEVPAFIPKLGTKRNKNYSRSIAAAFAGDMWTWIFLAIFAALLIARRMIEF